MCVVSVVYLLIFLLEKRFIMGAGLNIESLLWVEESEITLFFLPELVLLQSKK